MAAAVRQNVIKYITDRPGEVVLKDEIMKALNLEAGQVTAAVLAVQRGTVLADELHTVVRGNAWRYVPRSSSGEVTVAAPLKADPNLPLTSILREYLVNHPHEVVTLDQLVAFTDRKPEQVRSGITNMRYIRHHDDVTPHVHAVVGGRMWMYSPPDDRATTPDPTPPTQTVVEPGARNGQVVNVEASGGRVFEEVGELRDGRLVIQDQDGNTYAATPLQ